MKGDSPPFYRDKNLEGRALLNCCLIGIQILSRFCLGKVRLGVISSGSTGSQRRRLERYKLGRLGSRVPIADLQSVS